MNKIARNIYIDDDIWEKLRIISVKKKKSASKIINDLVKKFLNKEERKA